MKKYLSFFRIRFQTGLQYRAAAWGGMLTQFAWGFMYLLLYNAFYAAEPGAYPMSLTATSSYVWLNQAFLMLFAIWGGTDGDVLNSIMSGQIAVELIRPLDLYAMWMARAYAVRLSQALLRCLPILAVAALLPEPYGLRLPPDPAAALLFPVSAALSLTLVVALTMLVYEMLFFTVSANGLRTIVNTLVDFCSGGILPLPFFPEGLRQALELSPFGSLQNVCLRIYSGDIAGTEALRRIGLQLFWCGALIGLGKWLFTRCRRRVVVQGG